MNHVTMPREPTNEMALAVHAAIASHKAEEFTGKEPREGLRPIYDALVSAGEARDLPEDVVRLVLAARDAAFGPFTEEVRLALDQASEAFADRVPWDDEPTEEEIGS